MKSKWGKSLATLTECALMIALSTVLSVFKLFELPYGGSITLASCLPLVVLSYRHGVRYSVPSALCASLIQALLGLKNFSYFTTWQSIVALLVFDYVIAFAIFGFSGIFKKIIKIQSVSMIAGAVFASVIRYICHVISGATIWAGLSIPTEAALLYSLSYNATYMIPETIIVVLCTAYLGSALNLKREIPVRVRSEKLDTISVYSLILAGLAMLAVLITDTVLVFSKLQNYSSGEFMIEALKDVDWHIVLAVTAVGIIISASLVVITMIRSKRQSVRG